MREIIYFFIILVCSIYASYQKFNGNEVHLLIWFVLAYFLYQLIKGCGPQKLITHEEAKELLIKSKLPKE